MFRQFLIKSVDSGRVLKSVTMAVGAGDSVGGCDSKMARKSALFSCALGYWMGDELAVGVVAGR